jgi:N-acylneuraminate cytidylyltransferase
VTDIYVSTDDERIADVAAACGAGVIARPSALATDTATTEAGLTHAVSSLALDDDVVVVVPQVTSPLRWPSHISEAYQLVLDRNYDSVFTGVRLDDICVWSLDGTPRSVTYDFRKRKIRQDSLPLVVENGSVYCTTAGGLVKSGNRLNGQIGVSLMPKWTLPEIDDRDDAELCEVLMAAYVLPRSE